MSKKEVWKPIPNKSVVHVWASDCDEDCESHGKEVRIHPDYYNDSGIPICQSCGDDFSYCHTEIKE